jgi:hypothetical protein
MKGMGKLVLISLGLFLGIGIVSTNTGTVVDGSNISDKPSEAIRYGDDPYENLNEVSDMTLNVLSVYTTTISASINIKVNLSDESTNSYYVGYYSSDNYYPATLLCEVTLTDGSIDTKEAVIPIENSTSNFYGLGYIGSDSLDLNARLALNPGEEVKQDSFTLYNIFKATKEDGKPYQPEFSVNNKVSGTKTTSFRSFDISEIASIKYQGYASLGFYSVFNFYGVGFGDQIYSQLGAKYKRLYESNSTDIESGISYVRTRINFTSSSFIFFLKDGSQTSISYTRSLDININNGNDIDVIVSGIDPKEVEDVQFYNTNINIDIYSTSTSKTVPQSNVMISIAYADLSFKDLYDASGTLIKEGSKGTFAVDCLAILIAVPLAILAIYSAGAILKYLYERKKYAQDEFRRVKTRPYFKTASLGVLAIDSFAISIMSIVMRIGVFNDSLMLYNPIDAVIIVSCVISILFIIYFTRYFATQVKNILDKRVNDKLAKNRESDDGTIQLKKVN